MCTKVKLLMAGQQQQHTKNISMQLFVLFFPSLSLSRSSVTLAGMPIVANISFTMAFLAVVCVSDGGSAPPLKPCDNPTKYQKPHIQ